MEISDDVRLNEWLKKRWGHYSIENGREMDHDNKTSTSSKNQIKNLITLTVNKLQQNISVLEKEYNEIEQVPPAPGNSWGQHDTMVAHGLCKKACQHPRKNRYCNLFPFDENIVQFEDPNQYINASWVKILPWHLNRRYKIRSFFLKFIYTEQLKF